MLVVASAESSEIIDSESLNDNPSLPNGFSFQSVQDSVRYLERNPQSVLFSLYPDMTSRDLLTRGGTNDDSNVVWRPPTRLTRAILKGLWAILDGIDALLMEQGQLDFPDGNRIPASTR